MYSPRYIFTKLEKITRTIFHPDDDSILNHLHEDGDQIEPEFYMPVIPMVLVNGAEGIGTGYSTKLPNYSPREIIENLRRKIRGEETKEMHPQYFGFTGEIKQDPSKSGSYTHHGKIERIDDETLLITELPIKRWTQDYKVFLEKLMTGVPAGKPGKGKKETAKVEPEIKDFKENHTDTTVSFTVIASKEQIDGFEKEKGGLEAKFKLSGNLNTSNMTLFDENSKIVKFDTSLKILDYFYGVRLEYYGKRKAHLLKIMRRDQKMLQNKARFIEEVCAGDLVVSNRKRSDILTELKERKYDIFNKQDDGHINSSEESDDDESDDTTHAELAKGYEYLLGMKIWSLTFEKAEKIRQELAEKTKAVADLDATPPTSLWETDLDAIEEALDERDKYYADAAAEELEAQNNSKTNKKRGGKKKAAPKKKRPAKKATVASDDDDDDDVVRKTEKPPANDASLEDYFDPVKKASTKKVASKPPKKPVAKKAPVKKCKPKVAAIELDDDSDSEPESMSIPLMARMKKKDGKPGATKISRKRASPRSNEASSDSEDLESFDATKFEAASLTPAPKKLKQSTKSKMKVKPINLEDDSDEDSSLKSPVKKRKPAKKIAKKKVVEEVIDDFSEDEEEEFDEDILEDSDDDFVSSSHPAPRSNRSRGARNAKRTTYTEDSDSDDDFEFDD